MNRLQRKARLAQTASPVDCLVFVLIFNNVSTCVRLLVDSLGRSSASCFPDDSGGGGCNGR